MDQKKQNEQKKNQRLFKINQLRSTIKKVPLFVDKKSEMLKKYEDKKQEKLKQIQKPKTLNHSLSEETLNSFNELPEDLYSPFQQRYQLYEKIGEGAHGIVKKCRHRQTQQLFAVKILRLDDQQIVSLKRNFVNIQSLTYPYIIKYKAMYFDEKKRCCYLVMEYFPYPTLLQAKIKSQQELKKIIYRILETLQYLHDLNICHRDIKPENILYDQQTQVIRIIDFGISKYTFERAVKTDMLTNTGTLYYKAPQMFLGGGYDHRVDMWALGVTLYQLISKAKKTPFQSIYHNQTISNILKGQLKFQEQIWKQYSFAKDLIIRLLKNKRERLSAQEAKTHYWFVHSNALSLDIPKQNQLMAFSALYDKPLKQKNMNSIEEFNRNKSQNMQTQQKGCIKKQMSMISWLKEENATNLDLTKSQEIQEEKNQKQQKSQENIDI